MLGDADRQFPGAVWSFSIGWGCDKLITAADMAPVRSALATATTPRHDGVQCQAETSRVWSARAVKTGRRAAGCQRCGAGFEWRRCLRWSTSAAPRCPPTPTACGRPSRAWFDVPLSAGHRRRGVVRCSTDRNGSVAVCPTRDPTRRLTPDVARGRRLRSPVCGSIFNQQQLVGGGTSRVRAHLGRQRRS